jgi:hypothetical protein
MNWLKSNAARGNLISHQEINLRRRATPQAPVTIKQRARQSTPLTEGIQPETQPTKRRSHLTRGVNVVDTLSTWLTAFLFRHTLDRISIAEVGQDAILSYDQELQFCPAA